MNIIADKHENINYGMFGINSTLGGLDMPQGIYKEVTEQFLSKPLILKDSEA